MITMTGYAFAGDANGATRLTAPIAAPHQGRAVPSAATGTSVWRLRGKRATTPSDSELGALPA